MVVLSPEDGVTVLGFTIYDWRFVARLDRPFIPKGHHENSPAFQPRGPMGMRLSPEGTVEWIRRLQVQPSLRDSFFVRRDPALKRRAIVGSPFGTISQTR